VIAPREKAEKQVKVKIGGYPSEAEAKNDLRDFIHADVFQRRSAIFPDPRQFKVTPEVVEAVVDRDEDGGVERWKIDLTMSVTSVDVNHINVWEKALHRCAIVLSPGKPVGMTDRAKHVKEMRAAGRLK
jgi:hypothetical protein